MHPDTSTFPEHEHLKCPRCDSTNTKFCYYNNYNLSQPRHFCKNCRRYWTKGGTLRNIPIGGGTRKISKRTSGPTKRASTVALPPPSVPVPVPLPKAEPEPGYRVGSNSNNFNNSINNNHQMESGGYPMGPFGNLLMEGLNFSLVSKSDEEMLIRNPIAAAVDDDDDDFRSNFLKMNENNDDNNNNNRSDGVERGDWNGGESGWPDLSIFTPGSSFH